MSRESRSLRALALPILAVLAMLTVAPAAGQTDDGDAPTVEEAKAFVDEAEARLLELTVQAERAAWVQSTYITHDTQILAARAYEKLITAQGELGTRAARFDGLELPDDVARKLRLLKTAITVPAPEDPEAASELTTIASRLEATYGTGEYCPPGADGDEACKDLGELERIMAKSRDPEELLEAWAGWRTIAPPMRDDYGRFVELMNRGAQRLGYADTGVLWRAGYDMPPEQVPAELDRLWEQVRPLYEELHCYVRAELTERYGPEVVPPDGLIPAHVVGNMWAQSWGNIYPVVAPEGADPGYDLTEILEREGFDPIRMTRTGERFFTSLGFPPLPETFWERSLFTKPRDRDVVCHPSAWDVDAEEDLRLKMCIEVDQEDFATIHHELGHNFYQRAYNDQPFLYRAGANDGFHEAIGDAIALSVTPSYLVEIGLLDEEPDASADVGLLLKAALDKVAFVPFGRLIDEWRFRVFSGEVPPERYNEAWWELREKYQGIGPPVARTEDDFDPGAKYHVPGNTPYTRYFLAHILQYQFHRALCEASGWEGPLHRCSIYADPEAGRRMREMLALGASRPWPDALEVVTGERRMDATAILEYFAPLREWLEQQNAGRTCGW